MPSTIELLETIGRNASLRHAPSENVAKALADLNASENLTRAAALGTAAPLTLELGHRVMAIPHHVNQTCPDDEEEEVRPNPEDGYGSDDTDPGQNDGYQHTIT